MVALINQMASRRKETQENISFQIMKLVSENPKISTRQIAIKVGISKLTDK